MGVGVLGLSYWCSDLVIREEFIRTLEKIFKSYSNIFVTSIPLFTCNRVELYFYSENAEFYLNFLTRIIGRYMKISSGHFYSYFNEYCFSHLIRVTGGLDSPIFGETEIQGQVKRSYQLATTQKKLPTLLHLLFQKSLHIGKKIRAKENFYSRKNALEYLLFSIITEKFLDDVFAKKILFVGFSGINRKIFSFFFRKGFYRLDFFSLSHNKDMLNSDHKKYSFICASDVHSKHDYDVIILGSYPKNPTFSVINVLIESLYRKEIIFDLGVPRHVDLNSISKTTSVYNMDDLNKLLLIGSLTKNSSQDSLKEYIFNEVNKHWNLSINKICRSHRHWAAVI